MFQDCRLGLKDPDHRRIGRHVKLTPDDIDVSISRVPKDWHLGVPWDSDDLGNRSLNNCGPAAIVNWSNLMAKVAGLDEQWGLDEAKRIYTRLGWDGTNAGDDGVVLLDAMYQWMIEPFCGRKLAGFYVISHGEASHVATANCIAPLIAAASLTQPCMSTGHWTSKEASGRVKGNHAFLYFADSPGGGMCKTWGKPVAQDDEFRQARWIEAYLPILPELMPHVALERVIRIARQL